MLATSKYLTCIVEALKLHFIKYTNVLLNQIDVYIQKMSAIFKKNFNYCKSAIDRHNFNEFYYIL